MDENGCLPISTISSFKRVKELTSHRAHDRVDFIESALVGSEQVELVVKDGQKMIRAKASPTKWILTDQEQQSRNIPDSLLPASASSVEILGQSNQQENQPRKVGLIAPVLDYTFTFNSPYLYRHRQSNNTNQ